MELIEQQRQSFLLELERVENLPTLPIVARQLVDLIANPRTSMAQIATVIAKDPAIAARVIRLVNSAFYGLRERVGSIQHAIVVLGLNTVKNLVLGVSVVKVFEQNNKASIFDRDRFWIHTFACAQGAKLLATHNRLTHPDDYFIAGLLHDIGILILDQFFHDRFVETLTLSLNEHLDYLEAEQRIFGVTHEEIGALVAQRWRVPAYITNCMRYHHSPSLLPAEASADRNHVAVIHVADIATKEHGLANFIQSFRPSVDQHAGAQVNISSTIIEEIFDQVKTDVKSLKREWGL